MTKPQLDRALTDEELAAVRPQLRTPVGGWSDIRSPLARQEKRWHTYIEGNEFCRQDIISGLIAREPMPVRPAAPNRKMRRAAARRARG